MRIEEFIEASNKATSVEELFELYKTAMADLGFDRLIFSLMTDHLSIERSAGHGIMLNYPADWMNFYAEHHYQVTDPVRHKMYTSPGVFTWQSLVQPERLTKTQMHTLAQGDEAGLHDGIGVPLRGPRGAIAGNRSRFDGDGRSRNEPPPRADAAAGAVEKRGAGLAARPFLHIQDGIPGPGGFGWPRQIWRVSLQRAINQWFQPDLGFLLITR